MKACACYAPAVQSRDCVKIGSPDPPPTQLPTSPPPILASLSTQHNDQLTTLCLQIVFLSLQYIFNHLKSTPNRIHRSGL